MTRSTQRNFALLLLAEGLTFGCITLLQIFEFPLFLVVLLLMHGGIVLFFISRKRFIAAGQEVKSFYLKEYLMLAAYLPILAYKLLSLVFSYPVDEPAKLTVTLLLTALNVGLTLVNMIGLRKRLMTGKPEKAELFS